MGGWRSRPAFQNANHDLLEGPAQNKWREVKAFELIWPAHPNNDVTYVGFINMDGMDIVFCSGRSISHRYTE